MKKPYLSKTLWMNVIVALVAFFPGAEMWVSAHPDVFMWVFAGLNFALRLVTKDKVQLS